MVLMMLFTVSSSSCCWCCSSVLFEETLSSCCSNSPMMAVCLSIRVWSCSFSSLKTFSSTCLCSSISSTLFCRKLSRGGKRLQQQLFALHVIPMEFYWRSWELAAYIVWCVIWCTHLFLSFSLLSSFVWEISCFSNLLVDREFSRSLRSSRVVWWITWKEMDMVAMQSSCATQIPWEMFPSSNGRL